MDAFFTSTPQPKADIPAEYEAAFQDFYWMCADEKRSQMQIWMARIVAKDALSPIERYVFEKWQDVRATRNGFKVAKIHARHNTAERNSPVKVFGGYNTAPHKNHWNARGQK